MKRGAQPTHSVSSPGSSAGRGGRSDAQRREAAPDPALDENLLKAHMRMRGDEYVASVYATTLWSRHRDRGRRRSSSAILFVSAGVACPGLVIGDPAPGPRHRVTFFVLKGAPASKAKDRGTQDRPRIRSGDELRLAR